MVEFLSTHLIETLWTVLIGAVTWIVKNIAKDIQREKAEQDAIREAVQSLNHDRIYSIFEHSFRRYKETGKGMSLEERRNLQYLFEGYEKLGGNGTGKDLYKRCMALPVEESEELR